MEEGDLATKQLIAKTNQFLNRTVKRAKTLAKESGHRFLNLDQKIQLLFHMQHHYKQIANVKSGFKQSAAAWSSKRNGAEGVFRGGSANLATTTSGGAASAAEKNFVPSRRKNIMKQIRRSTALQERKAKLSSYQEELMSEPSLMEGGRGGSGIPATQIVSPRSRAAPAAPATNWVSEAKLLAFESYALQQKYVSY